jgi:glycosyltransferase involved in cell wall biosynthesis
LTRDVYWYAPFNNGDEWSLADGVAQRGNRVVLHSVGSRFGQAVIDPPGAAYEAVRDLPEPAIESGRGAPSDRAMVAIERARLRHAAVRGGEYDILHIHTVNLFTDWHSFRVLRRLGVPLVLSVHNVHPHDQRLPAGLDRHALRRAYRLADHLVVAHAELRQLLVRDFGIASDRIDVVPLPIRTQRVATQTENQGRVLFFGTLRRNKGLDVLFEAVRQIPKSMDFTLVVAGRGDSDLEALAREEASRDARIRVEIGFVSPDRKAELFSAAAAVVMPYTDFAAQSGVLQDAYSYNVPVIVSRLGALGATVETDGTGWLVAPGDAGALAAACIAAVRDEASRLQFERRQREVSLMLSPYELSGRLCDIYERCLN